MAAKNKGKILVVDDNAGIRGALKVLLPMHFTDVELIATPKELISKIQEFKPNAVLLDMNFHTDINTGNEGLYWLAEIKKCFPAIEVVLFTAYADIQLAVEGMKRGAFDFIVKPWDNQKLIEILANAVQKNQKDKQPAAQSNSILPSRCRTSKELLEKLPQQMPQYSLQVRTEPVRMFLQGRYTATASVSDAQW